MERQVDYSGMTVNERLFSAGLVAEWDVAVRGHHRQRMIELLNKVELGDQAESIADTILANPHRYGF